MSMKPHGLEPIPEETRHLAERLCPKGTMVMQLRDALGPIYHDEAFAHLFAKRGRAAEAPWRLAMVTVLQAMEGLTDRQAAQFVRTRIDWLYALGLPLDDPGFDASILSDFRQRLLDGQGQDLLVEPILQVCRERGWLQAGGKQRTDSTAVLAAVRSLNSLESVGESMRAALDAIAQVEPDWLLAHLDPDWFDRYVHRFELARFPKAESKRSQLRAQVGADGQRLLSLMEEEQTPQRVRGLPEVGVLRQVFFQHYQIVDQHVRWRDGPAVSNEQRLVSPSDEEARSSRKRETVWLGDKVHLTETCDQDAERPHLIVHVETTPATLQDAEVLASIQQQMQVKDLLAGDHLLDQGYISGQELLTQAHHGSQIVGPVPANVSWQQRLESGYGVEDFELDWDAKVATCPQGQQSRSWHTQLDRRKQPTEVIRFASKVCQGCPLRERCTHSKQGRSLTLNVREVHEALVQRRREQTTAAFVQRYNRRAGVEGTISQAVRTTQLRRTPYVGVRKTHLHHVAIAAALNCCRITAYLQARARNQPPRPARPLSPFARLKQRSLAACG